LYTGICNIFKKTQYTYYKTFIQLGTRDDTSGTYCTIALYQISVRNRSRDHLVVNPVEETKHQPDSEVTEENTTFLDRKMKEMIQKRR
jgi:hypothetical protein